MAKDDIKPKAEKPEVKKPVKPKAEKPEVKKPVKPKAEKPAGFKAVVFNYNGRNIHHKDKQFMSYVKPEIAEMYKKKSNKQIVSVE